MTVAVVGAGLAGLSAAWDLCQARQPGGMIVTERRDGFVVEGGPDGFLAAEPDLQELAREVGIGERLVDQTARGSALWTGRGLEALADGKAAELLGIQVNVDVGGFRSFAAGMAEVVEALVACLVPRLRTTQGVTAVVRAGGARGWRLSFTGGSALEAEALILAVPAWVAARLLAGLGVSTARALDTVLYAPSITVSLAYREDQVPQALEGAGFVVALDSGAALRACTYAWRKYPKRAPEGYALLRAFVGPVDGDPSSIAHAELAAILGIEGDPLWTRAFYWPRGLPRYPRGHGERVAAVRDRLARLPPLAIAGAGFDGAGVSACVKSGREAAKQILERLGTARPVRG